VPTGILRLATRTGARLVYGVAKECARAWQRNYDHCRISRKRLSQRRFANWRKTCWNRRGSGGNGINWDRSGGAVPEAQHVMYDSIDILQHPLLLDPRGGCATFGLDGTYPFCEAAGRTAWTASDC